MRRIALTKGLYAKVDDGDYEWLNEWKWYARTDARGNSYAARRKRTYESPPGGYVTMHRALLEAPSDMQVDHADGNGLNNRRSNIRLCDHGQNIHNQKISSRNTSGVKGAFFDKKSGTWKSAITRNNKIIYLGRFDSREEAGRAYREAATAIYGEFARNK